MKSVEIFSHIESINFENQMSLASGFKIFERFLRNKQIYWDLLDKIAQEQEVTAKQVATRAFYLLKQRGDTNFAHPHDVAIAVYLLALIETFPEMAKEVLSFSADGLFWTRFAAEKLQKTLLLHENSSTSPVLEINLSQRGTQTSDKTISASIIDWKAVSTNEAVKRNKQYVTTSTLKQNLIVKVS